MIGWKRAAHMPARRSRRKPVSLQLERLEDRVLLDASSTGQAASTLLVDLSHLRNDLATSALTLVNAVSPSQTNQYADAGLHCQPVEQGVERADYRLAADATGIRPVRVR